MQLDLRILGREVNDGMLEAIKDFLVHHKYEGEYQISIQKAEVNETAFSIESPASIAPATTIPSGRVRPRITAAPPKQVQKNKLYQFQSF